MFIRHALSLLNQWREYPHRKPLIIRGPRQVGKTTVVHQFGQSFESYLYYNLDKEDDRLMLERPIPLEHLLPLLFARQGKAYHPEQALLFIDEIQTSPSTMSKLRYFYEDHPELCVVAAGSLLENVVDIHASFPVGRVDYMALRPCSFREFLTAMGKEHLHVFLDTPEYLDAIHNELMSLFNQYIIVGGMPEVVNAFSQNHDPLAQDRLYRQLLQGYRDDVEKYVLGRKMTDVVRLLLDKGWQYAGQTIALGNLCDSGYSSKEVGEAFRLLEKAMLVERVYPTTSTCIPSMPQLKRQPKLIWFDTGLVNYAAGVRKEVIGANDVVDVWRGRIAEHVVAQELLALNDDVSQKRSFWMKEGGGGSAEVDFIWTLDSCIIPIEVKNGHNSHLRSLHAFVDASPVGVAVRVWSGKYSIDDVQTTIKHKPFKLINLPFYLICNLEKIVRQYL